MIDVFDKFMHVALIKGKMEEDLASGMIECLHKTGRKPRILYTDDEGALSKESIQTYWRKQKIEHHWTRAHENLSERAIKAFKDILYKIVEADEKKATSNIQCIREINADIRKSNETLCHKIRAERGTETKQRIKRQVEYCQKW